MTVKYEQGSMLCFSLFLSPTVSVKVSAILCLEDYGCCVFFIQELSPKKTPRQATCLIRSSDHYFNPVQYSVLSETCFSLMCTNYHVGFTQVPCYKAESQALLTAGLVLWPWHVCWWHWPPCDQSYYYDLQSHVSVPKGWIELYSYSWWWILCVC